MRSHILPTLTFSAFLLWGHASAQSGDFSRVMIDLSGEDQNALISSLPLGHYGVKIVFHRATLGVPPDVEDHGFRDAARLIKAAGYQMGAYHVIFPKSDELHSGAAQARAYISALQEVCRTMPGEKIAMAVDWEQTYRLVKESRKKTRVPAGIATPTDVADFLTEVKTEASGAVPIVYTGTDILAKYRNDAHSDLNQPILNSSPLWIATYQQRFYKRGSQGDSSTKVTTLDRQGKSQTQNARVAVGYIFPLAEDISPWSDWTFWQHGGGDKGFRDVTTKSQVRLGKSLVDMSFFNGSRQEFEGALMGNSFACPG